MNFNHFKNNIPKLTTIPVGGLEAQLKLTPKTRLNYSQEKIESQNPKKAAVLALFYPNENGDTNFLLTLRASYNGTHSAQISFPGGRFDEKDNTLKITALRETFEEVGIQSDNIEIVKQFTNVYIPPSNFLATPFLGYLDSPPTFKINHEVELIINVLLADLMDDASISTTTLTTSYAKNIEVPCFVLNKHVVWGATAMILNEIRDLFLKL